MQRVLHQLIYDEQSYFFWERRTYMVEKCRKLFFPAKNGESTASLLSSTGSLSYLRALSSVKLPAHGKSSATRMWGPLCSKQWMRFHLLMCFIWVDLARQGPRRVGRAVGSRRLALLWQGLMAPKPGNESWPMGRCGWDSEEAIKAY